MKRPQNLRAGYRQPATEVSPHVQVAARVETNAVFVTAADQILALIHLAQSGYGRTFELKVTLDQQGRKVTDRDLRALYDSMIHGYRMTRIELVDYFLQRPVFRFDQPEKTPVHHRRYGP